MVASRRFDPHGGSVEKTLSTPAQARTGGTRELDVLGRTVAETDQNGDTTRYEYALDDLPATITTGYGAVTTHTYHPVTRALVETAPSPRSGTPCTPSSCITRSLVT